MYVNNRRINTIVSIFVVFHDNIKYSGSTSTTNYAIKHIIGEENFTTLLSSKEIMIIKFPECTIPLSYLLRQFVIYISFNIKFRQT